MANQQVPQEKAAAANLEAGVGGPMGRQLSVQLTNEQFERLYLQPGGEKAKGDLSKRLGNPTSLGIISFLLCLTPVSCYLMGFASTNATSSYVGSTWFYFIGGIGLTVSGLLEWILGNTFPFVVFFSFGGFWLTFGAINDVPNGATAGYATGAEDPAFNQGIAFYLLFWGVYVFLLLLASLRTNIAFVCLFFVLDIAFFLLTAAYFNLGYGNASYANTLLIAGGAFAFLTCLCGWWILAALLFGATGLPLNVPVGDLTNFWAKRKNM